MISQMDHNVGRLLDTLKACGLDQKYHRHFYQRQRHHA